MNSPGAAGMELRPRTLHGPLTTAPRWVALGCGLLLVVGGVLLVTRPLTSLVLLAVYVGLCAIATGMAELLTRHTRRWRQVLAVAWIAVGLFVLVRLELSIQVLPVIVAVLLGAGALAGLAEVRRGRLSRRALSASWVLAQAVLAVLAVLWPDMTLIAVAVLFGARTLLFGASLLWQQRPWRADARADSARADGAARPDSARTDSARADGAAPAGSRPAGSSSAPARVAVLGADAARWVAAVTILAVTAGTWFVSHRLRAEAPVVDAFYDAPAQVPDSPGRLLRVDDYPGQTPTSSSGRPGAVQRILYTTTDAHGDPALASALVIAPADLGEGPHPVVSWNHGTTGIARACAPSLTDTAAMPEAIPAVEQALEAGWVVVATDYSGQGTEGDFPYLIGQGQARSALDGIRAAGELPDLHLADEVAVWGHSQGGHAALWTGHLAPEYAPELDVVGTAAISPAADPYALADRLAAYTTSGPMSVAAAWVLIPYSRTYEDIDFDDYVTLPGRALVREMSQRCTTEPGLLVSVLAGLGVSHDRPLFTGDITGGALGERLAENRTLGPFDAPVLMAWGSEDEVIAADLQHDYVAALCEAGTERERQGYQWQEYDGYDHMQIVQPDSNFVEVLAEWTAARFDSEPPEPSSC